MNFTRSRAVIVVLAVGLLGTLLVIVLWQTGAAFGRPETTPCAAPEGVLERAILSVPVYDPSAHTTEQTLAKEETVMEHIRDQTRLETISAPALAPEVPTPSITPPRESRQTLIERIYHISRDPDRQEAARQAFGRLELPSSIPRQRLTSDTVQHPLLSHIACLSKAYEHRQNALIVEDGVVFSRPPHDALRAVDERCGNRWDVVCFDQEFTTWQQIGLTKTGVKMCRLLDNSSLRAYLVRAGYIPVLLTFLIQKMRQLLQEDRTEPATTTETIEPLCQQDLWIGFHVPLVPGRLYLTDLSACVDTQDRVQHLQVEFSVTRPLRVAVCAFSDWGETSLLRRDLESKFLKLHRLEFLSLEGTSPWRAMQEVVSPSEHDYVFYVPHHFRVYRHVHDDDVISSGLTVTEGLQIGRPPSDPDHARFSLSFHGGPTADMERLWRSLAHVDPDEDLERAFNRQLIVQRPTTVLPPSYLYHQKCVSNDCTEPMCRLLRESGLKPVMGAVVFPETRGLGQK